MPPTNILVADIDATNTDKLHQVYITDFNTLTQLGDDIDDTSLGAGTVGDPRHQNRVIAAWGTVYCLSREGVYRLQTGSQFGTWSKEPEDGGYTFDLSLATQRSMSGPFFMVIDNIPYLVGQYGDGSTVTWRLNLLTGAGEESSSSPSYGIGRISDMIYSGQYHAANGFQRFLADFVTLTPTRLIPFPGSGPNSGAYGEVNDWHIFNGRLYMLGQTRPSGGGFNGLPTLFEWEGGIYQGIINFQTTPDTYGTAGARWCLFDDGTRMYAIYWDDRAGQLGWRMAEINLVGGQLELGNDITTTVLPSGLRPGGGPSNTSAWFVYKDLQSDGAADIYLGFAINNGASTYTLYQFTDNITELASVASGIDSRLQISISKFGGGDRSIDLTAPTVCVYAREKDPLGERVTFRAFPPLQPPMGYDGTDLIVNFYLATDYGVPMTAATLVGDVTGGSASRSLNSVLNVSTDGTTDYTAVIQATSFSHLDNINIIAEIT